MSTVDVGNLIGLGVAPALAGILGGKWSTATAAGSAITDGTDITTKLCLVDGADATKGVVMKAIGAGEVSVIKNADNAVLKVYPPTTSVAFNSGTAGAAVSIAAYAGVIIIGRTSTDYIALEAAAA